MVGPPSNSERTAGFDPHTLYEKTRSKMPCDHLVMDRYSILLWVEQAGNDALAVSQHDTSVVWLELFAVFSKCSRFCQSLRCCQLTGAYSYYQTKASANMTLCRRSLYYQPEQCTINGKSHRITYPTFASFDPPKHVFFNENPCFAVLRGGGSLIFPNVP